MNQTTKIILGATVLGVVGFFIYKTLNPKQTTKPKYSGATDVELRKIENICETRFNTEDEVKRCVYNELNGQLVSGQKPVGRKPMPHN